MLKAVTVCAIAINLFLICLADSDITCWKYPESSGLKVSYSNDNKVNSTAKFRCSAGMTLIGSNSSICQHNGTWSNLWPICENPDGCHLNKFASPNLLIEPVKENYHFGDFIALSCSPGHKLTGNTRRVICLGNFWSDELPVCIENARSRPQNTTEKKAACDLPSAPEHGFIQLLSSADNPRAGSIAIFSCEEDRVIDGPSSSKCLENGQWNFPSPRCLKAACDLPSVPEHGFMQLLSSTDKPRAGSIAIFSCEEDRIIDGPSTLKCLENGQWTFPSPRCLIAPTYVPSTTKTVVSTSLKEILRRTSPAVPSNPTAQTTPIFEITTTTRKPFVEDSSEGKLDEVTSSVTPKVADCFCEYPINDENLVAFVHGKRLQFRDKVTDGTQVVFRCKNIFIHRIHGPRVNKCENCGSWHTTVFPTCSEPGSVVNIRCPEIDGKGVYRIRYSGYRRINSTAMFYCKDRLQILKGRNFWTCQQNGEWSGTLPTCIDLVTCGKFEDSPGLEVSYSNDVRVFSTASFQCQPPNTLIGSASSICRPNGTWSLPLPKCEVPAARCSIDALLSSLPVDVIGDITSVTEEVVEYGTNIPLLCEEGLIHIGSSTAKCERRGKWEFGNMQCVQGCKLDDDVSPDLLIEPVKEFYRFGDSISLWCPPGQELTTSVVRVLCLGRAWSDEIPECIYT